MQSVTDVADALNQLEEDRRQLQEYQALARSVGHFTDRYRSYVKTQSRRQARGLRAAQTGFDNASRALNDARSELEALQAAEEEANAALLVAKETVSASRALDYRRWHRFTVQRWQDKQWRKLSGPASSGARALGRPLPRPHGRVR